MNPLGGALPFPQMPSLPMPSIPSAAAGMAEGTLNVLGAFGNGLGAVVLDAFHQGQSQQQSGLNFQDRNGYAYGEVPTEIFQRELQARRNALRPKPIQRQQQSTSSAPAATASYPSAPERAYTAPTPKTPAMLKLEQDIARHKREVALQQAQWKAEALQQATQARNAQAFEAKLNQSEAALNKLPAFKALSPMAVAGQTVDNLDTVLQQTQASFRQANQSASRGYYTVAFKARGQVEGQALNGVFSLGGTAAQLMAAVQTGLMPAEALVQSGIKPMAFQGGVITPELPPPNPLDDPNAVANGRFGDGKARLPDSLKRPATNPPDSRLGPNDTAKQPSSPPTIPGHTGHTNKPDPRLTPQVMKSQSTQEASPSQDKNQKTEELVKETAKQLTEKLPRLVIQPGFKPPKTYEDVIQLYKKAGITIEDTELLRVATRRALLAFHPDTNGGTSSIEQNNVRENLMVISNLLKGTANNKVASPNVAEFNSKEIWPMQNTREGLLTMGLNTPQSDQSRISNGETIGNGVMKALKHLPTGTKIFVSLQNKGENIHVTNDLRVVNNGDSIRSLSIRKLENGTYELKVDSKNDFYKLGYPSDVPLRNDPKMAVTIIRPSAGKPDQTIVVKPKGILNSNDHTSLQSGDRVIIHDSRYGTIIEFPFKPDETILH